MSIPCFQSTYSLHPHIFTQIYTSFNACHELHQLAEHLLCKNRSYSTVGWLRVDLPFLPLQNATRMYGSYVIPIVVESQQRCPTGSLTNLEPIHSIFGLKMNISPGLHKFYYFFLIWIADHNLLFLRVKF